MSVNPFWDFSLQHYAKAPVQEQCLQLQDQVGANVNVVLFTLWLASEKRLFDHGLVLAHAELLYWHEQVIVPLRQARFGVKQSGLSDALYEMVKKSELDAERVEQDILYSLLPQFAEASGELSLEQLAQWNLRAYLQVLPLAESLVEDCSEQLVAEIFVN
ncbi:MAG: TIGR02444 family protein [Pseudomonadales bacterium]